MHFISKRRNSSAASSSGLGTTLVYYAAYTCTVTGFEFQNGFRSSWRCWCIAASTPQHPTVCRQTFCSASVINARRLDDCALPVRQRSSLQVHAPPILPLATVHVFPALPAAAVSFRTQSGRVSSLATRPYEHRSDAVTVNYAQRL